MERETEESDLELWDIEEAINRTGSYGILQIFVSAVVMFFLFTSSYQTTILYYAANDPPWTCISNDTSDFCKHHFGENIEQSNSQFSQRCKLNRTEWRFTKDNSFSIVSEFDLICENSALAAITNSGFFIGWGITGLFMGYLTDIYGRKIIICLSILLLSIASITSSFISAVWQIICLRMLVGAAYGSVNTCAYTLMSEVVGSQHRVLAGALYNLPFDWSLLAATLLAYYVNHWRKLILYAALPSILLVILFMFLPESVRWLYARNKFEKCELLLKKTAKINRRIIPLFKLKENNEEEMKVNYSYTDLLFRHKKVIVLVVASSFGWLANGMIYYGFTLESSDLGGSIYVNFALSCMADIPTGIIVYFTCKHFGRKTSFMAFTCLACLSLVGLSIFSSLSGSMKYISVMKIVLAMIGKASISNSFAILYIWTFELYPTIVRSQGMTLCQIAGRIGSAIAPFIATTLSEIYQPMPFILMAVVCVITLFLSMVIPDTKYLKPREKFEDFFNDSSYNVSIEENVNESSSDREKLLSDIE